MSDKKFKRIFCIVIDSLGIGEEPDAAEYNDVGSDTLGHISQSVKEFTIPNLQKLGMANLHPLVQVHLPLLPPHITARCAKKASARTP